MPGQVHGELFGDIRTPMFWTHHTAAVPEDMQRLWYGYGTVLVNVPMFLRPMRLMLHWNHWWKTTLIRDHSNEDRRKANSWPKARALSRKPWLSRIDCGHHMNGWPFRAKLGTDCGQFLWSQNSVQTIYLTKVRRMRPWTEVRVYTCQKKKKKITYEC